MLIGVIAEELLDPLAVTHGATWIDTDVFWRWRIYEIGFLAPNILDETVDGSDEIFFQTYVTNGYQGIFPDLLDDPDENFYDFTHGFVPVLAPALVVAADSVYAPNLADKAVSFGRFVDTDIFYSPELRGRVLPGLVVDADVIRAQIIRRDGDAIVLLLESFDDTDVIYAPLTAKGLSPGLFTEYYPDNDRIYAASQTVFLTPSIFSSADVFLIPFVFNQLNPSGTVDTDTLFGPTVATPGRLGLFLDNDFFYVPNVGFAALAPALLNDSDTFWPSLIGDTPPLKPFDSVVDFDDTFYVPGVTVGLFLTPHFWPDIDDIKSVAGVVLGQVIAPTVVTFDTNVFYAPDLPPTLSPALFAETDNFFAPRLIFDQSLLDIWLIDADTFFAPSITALAGFDGAISLDGPIMPATPQPTVIYIEG